MTYITVVDDSPAGTVENLDKLMTDILAEPDGLAAQSRVRPGTSSSPEYGDLVAQDEEFDVRG